MHRVEKLSFKYQDQNFCIKIAFSGQLWKVLVFGVFNKNINFDTELAKKNNKLWLLFLIAISSPKNVNEHPSEMKN